MPIVNNITTNIPKSTFGGVTGLVAETLAADWASTAADPLLAADELSPCEAARPNKDDIYTPVLPTESKELLFLPKPVPVSTRLKSDAVFSSGEIAESPLPPNMAVIQMKVASGRPHLNADRLIAEMRRLAAEGIKVMFAGELVISGYMNGDTWFQDYFQLECEMATERVRLASEELGVTIAFGAPVFDRTAVNETGQTRTYNAVHIIKNGEYVSNGVLEGIVCKTNLPNYGPFDDKRYFHEFYKMAWEMGIDPKDLYVPYPIELDGETWWMAPVICEDSWDDDYTFKVTQLYLDYAKKAGIPEDKLFIVNFSCSPWRKGKIELVYDVMRRSRRDAKVPLIFAHQVGCQNIGKSHYAMYGASFVIGPDDALLASAKFLTEDTLKFNLQDLIARGAAIQGIKDNNSRAVYEALLCQIRDVWKGANAIIGKSGGIDSAVDAVLLVDALGANRVIALSMPSPHNKKETKDDGFLLAQKLGIRFGVMPIERVTQVATETLADIDFVKLDPNRPLTPKELYDPAFARMRERSLGLGSSETRTPDPALYGGREVTTLKFDEDLDPQNIQARIRGSVGLLGSAAPLKAMVVCNSNANENLIGYATYQGDILGGASLIADLFKMDVYDLADLINEIHGDEIIAKSVIKRPPSAELKKDQVDPIIFPYHGWLGAGWKEKHLHPYDLLRMYLNDRWDDKIPSIPLDRKGQHITSPRAFVQTYWQSVPEFLKDLRHHYGLFRQSFYKREQGPMTLAVGSNTWGFDFREAHIPALFGPLYDELEMQVLRINP